MLHLLTYHKVIVRSCQSNSRTTAYTQEEELMRAIIIGALLSIAASGTTLSAKPLRGGVLDPPTRPTHCTLQSDMRHCIEVNFRRKELNYWRVEDGRWQPVIGYLVITPESTQLQVGRVTQIVRRPQWCPTASGRRLYRQHGVRLGRGCVPYGHPYNPMGVAKFIIDGFGAKRIHGTRSFGKNWQDTETLGCVRVLNGKPGAHGMYRLLNLLGSNAVEEGITVVFY